MKLKMQSEVENKQSNDSKTGYIFFFIIESKVISLKIKLY